MATIPTIPTEAPGNFWTSALWNANILNGLGYLFAPVRFKAYASTGQSIATGASPATTINLDTEIVDSDSGHSTTTNTSRYTAQTAGLYLVGGSVCFATSATGARACQIFKNGGAIEGAANQAAGNSANGGSSFTVTLVQLAVGDYIELAVWQTSGGTLATQSGTSVVSTLWAVRVSS